MKKHKYLIIASIMFSLMYFSSGYAAIMIEAQSVWSASTRDPNLPMYGSDASFKSMINQNGLKTGYTSGVTKSSDYINSNPEHIYPQYSVDNSSGGYVYTLYEWFSSSSPSTNCTPEAGETRCYDITGSLYFDLGDTFNVEQILLWNEDSNGLEKFKISASDDLAALKLPDWGQTGRLYHLDSITNNNPMDQDYTADILDFFTIGRYIRLDILTVQPHVDNTRRPLATLGEIAFSVTPVPEPTTMLLFGTGIVGLLSLRRKMR